MMETSYLTVAGWMAWFHFAVLFVPVVIATSYLEYREWREAHPRQQWRPRLANLEGPWKPTSPFVMPI